MLLSILETSVLFSIGFFEPHNDENQVLCTLITFLMLMTLYIASVCHNAYHTRSTVTWALFVIAFFMIDLIHYIDRNKLVITILNSGIYAPKGFTTTYWRTVTCSMVKTSFVLQTMSIFSITKRYKRFQRYLGEWILWFLPIPIWYSFLQQTEMDSFPLSYSITMYIGYKITFLCTLVYGTYYHIQNYIHKNPIYGQIVAEEELCPICLEDGGSLRLVCTHIFHQNCLETWFEENDTCPICRQRVPPNQPKSIVLQLLLEKRPLQRIPNFL